MQSTQHSQVSKINRPASPRCFKIKVKNIEKAERSLWPPQTVENLTSTCGLLSANRTISISIKKRFFYWFQVVFSSLEKVNFWC